MAPPSQLYSGAMADLGTILGTSLRFLARCSSLHHAMASYSSGLETESECRIALKRDRALG